MSNSRKNGVAIAGFVLALVGAFPVFFSWIPILGWISSSFAFLLLIAGLICSSIGLKRAKKRHLGGKGLATAGLIISILALVAAVIAFIISIIVSVGGALLQFLPFLAGIFGAIENSSALALFIL